MVLDVNTTCCESTAYTLGLGKLTAHCLDCLLDRHFCDPRLGTKGASMEGGSELGMYVCMYADGWMDGAETVDVFQGLAEMGSS